MAFGRGVGRLDIERGAAFEREEGVGGIGRSW